MSDGIIVLSPFLTVTTVTLQLYDCIIIFRLNFANLGYREQGTCYSSIIEST